MTFDEFSADLPAERTVEFSSAEDMEEAFNAVGVEQPMRQLGRGAFRSALAATFTKHADFYSDRYNRKISLHLESLDGSIGIVSP